MTLLMVALSVLAMTWSAAAAEPSSSTEQTESISGPTQQMTLGPLDFGQSVPATPAACCKVCTTGKACGNSCISRTKTCHKPPGCACDAQ